MFLFTVSPLLYDPSPHSNPPPRTPLCLQCSRVTSAFSPNANPNRLSTEGYSSSSQKRRQIFRYWGHCWAWLVCFAMPIFAKWFADDSSHPVVFLSFAWHSGLIDGYSGAAPWGFPWPIAWLLCGLTGDWCNLSSHSVLTFFFVWFAFFSLSLFWFAVVHFQFLLLSPVA